MMYSTIVTRPAGLGGGRSTSCETRPYMCLRRVMRRVELRPDTDHTVRLRVYIVASDRACDRVVCRKWRGEPNHPIVYRYLPVG